MKSADIAKESRRANDFIIRPRASSMVAQILTNKRKVNNEFWQDH